MLAGTKVALFVSTKNSCYGWNYPTMKTVENHQRSGQEMNNQENQAVLMFRYAEDPMETQVQSFCRSCSTSQHLAIVP